MLVNSTSHDSVADALTATVVLVVLTVSVSPASAGSWTVWSMSAVPAQAVRRCTDGNLTLPVRSPAPGSTVTVAESFG